MHACKHSNFDHALQPEGQVVPCEYFAEEVQCNNRSICRWDNDFCVECETEDCKVSCHLAPSALLDVSLLGTG